MMSAGETVCPDCLRADALPVSSVGKAFAQASGGIGYQQPCYQIMECRACGLLFRTPTLKDEELAAYYAGLDGDHWEYAALTPPEQWISGLLASLPAGARVLDFGCSSGRLLSPWARLLACHGHEINAAASLQAADRGLRMLSRDELLSFAPGSFDMIILVDVFEHLRRPSELLIQLWRLLAPDGRLVVSTGNGDHWACRLDPAQSWYFRNLEHLCMLTSSYTARMSYRLGGKTESWEELSHYDVPFFVRCRLHAAHSLYWLLGALPVILRTAVSIIPMLGRAARWSNAPNYGCSRDHAVWVLRKPASVS